MGDLILASTTDSQEALDKAAGLTEAQSQDAALGRNQDDWVATEKLENPVTVSEPGQEDQHLGADEPVNGVEPQRPKGSRKDRRIDQLTREKYNLQARLEEMERRLAQHEPAPYTSEPQQAPDYRHQPIYQPNQQATQAPQQNDARVAALNARNKAELDAHYARWNEASQRYSDWDSVVTNSPLEVSPAGKLTIVKMENGPDVVHWLGTHPDECQAIAQLDDVRTVIALTRISERLLSPGLAHRPSGAAPPPRGLSGNGHINTPSLDDERMPYPEWRRIRDAQAKANFRR
jgi:hypothetical protein